MVYGWLAWRSVYSVPINASLDDLSSNSSLCEIYSIILLVVQYFRTWIHPHHNFEDSGSHTWIGIHNLQKAYYTTIGIHAYMY